MKEVKNLGEAISVLMQVAELAQSKGILTLDDAVIVKSSMDFIKSMAPTESKKEEGPSA